jgi:VWFA-related protein
LGALVNVLFTVTDKKSRLVPNLEKDDFRIREDRQPQAIRFFSRETDLPLRIGMLIDTGNSIRERLTSKRKPGSISLDFLLF